MLAALKRRFRKIDTGSIGCSRRSSHQHERPRASTRARAKPARVFGSSQPHSGASMMLNTSVVIAAIDSTMPPMSRRGAPASFDSGTRTTTATQRDDHDGHVDEEDRAPPEVLEQPAAARSGPAATAMPVTALQMPIALARSIGSRKTLVMMASVAGKISAAPTPMSARPAMSPPADVDRSRRAPTSRPNTTSPPTSIFLRPYRSPSPPAARSRPVNTSR